VHLADTCGGISTHRGGKNVYIVAGNPERKRKLLDLGIDRRVT
jgi:hypothetical protein